MLDGFKGVAATEGLNSQQATAVAGFYNDQLVAAEAAAKQQGVDWKEAVVQDKEIGGEKYAETCTLVNKAIANVDGGKEAQAFLDEIGVGNHPALVKFLRSVGTGFREDNSGGGGIPAGSDSPEGRLKSQYHTMYNADGSSKY